MARALAFVLLLLFSQTQARDLGQWETDDPAQKVIKEWYQNLKQPDAPEASCCGEADAYWCDDVHVRDGKTYCRITDDRPDEPRGRPHVPLGTEIQIPDFKLKWDKANPTGHAIVFLGGGYKNERWVFCFVQGTGI